MSRKNADDKATPNSDEDAAEPSRGLDVEDQPFNVNGPADAAGDQEQGADDSQDSSLPGRGRDVEDQPFNVNGPSDPKSGP